MFRIRVRLHMKLGRNVTPLVWQNLTTAKLCVAFLSKYTCTTVFFNQRNARDRKTALDRDLLHYLPEQYKLLGLIKIIVGLQ